MLPSESPIFAEQDDIYIYFFTAYGGPVRLEIQNPFFGPKSAGVTKGLSALEQDLMWITGSRSV